jgi:hypothetical protein
MPILLKGVCVYVCVITTLRCGVSREVVCCLLGLKTPALLLSYTSSSQQMHYRTGTLVWSRRARVPSVHVRHELASCGSACPPPPSADSRASAASYRTVSPSKFPRRVRNRTTCARGHAYALRERACVRGTFCELSAPSKIF